MSRRSLVRVLAIFVVAALGLIAAPISNAAAALLSGTVTGQPFEREFGPAVGVQVVVTPAEGGEAIATTTTSAKGNYSLLVPEGVFNVHFEAPESIGLKSTTVEKVSVGSARLLDVVLQPSELPHLTGTLSNAAGEPIAGTQIKMTNSRTTVETETNVEGSYSLVAPIDEYHLDVSGGEVGHVGVPVKFSFSTTTFFLGANEKRNITLPATSTVTVEVEVSGKPIQGALVSLREFWKEEAFNLGGFQTNRLNLPSAQVTTGVDGRAPFPIFDGSITSEFANAGTVILPGEEGSPRTFDVVFPINEDVALVEPPPAIVHLTGTIRDAAGNPVPGATLVVSGEKAVQEAETNSEGFYSLTTVPGVYGLVIEGHGNGLPPKWSVEIFLDLQRDKELNVNLPPTSTVTVEVLGTHGSPVTGATVGMPVYVSERADFGGLEPTAVESFLSLMATGKDGRATFLVFDGSPIKFGFRQHSQPGKVEPPSGSGYPSVEFAAPTVEADTATVVRLAGPEEVEEEESPPKEEETGPEEEETATGGPELTELFFESPEIDTGSEGFDVRVFARLIDGGGQIEKGFVTFERPSGEEQIFGSLERVSESESGAVLEGNAFFPRESEDGRWLATVHVFDSTGHELVLGPEELSVRGFVDAVDVVNSEPRAPVVTGISPNSGPETGGTEVIVSGTDFGGATAVHFGGSVAEFIPKSAETIIAFAPPGTGTADVTVTTSAGTSPTSEADRFTYTAPAPTVTLTSSPDPSVRGQKVTFVATVTSAGEGQPTPIGTVSFVEGSSTLGVVNLSKGVGKLSTTTLGAGEHPVVAEYGGDSHHSAANSAPLVQVVTKATTELTLSSSLNPAAYGGSATLKAHIAAVAPGAGTPAGTVTFLEGEAILETVQMSGGNATLKLKALAPGTHKITASYSGDANDEPSEGGPFVQTITAARTQLNLTSTLNPAAFGSAGTLKATVSSEAPGGGTPAGNVIFREGETVLATVPLSAGSAKYALKSIEPGEPKITATYGGEADYEASSDELLQVIVPASTEMTLTSSKNPAPHGSTGTLKATVRTLAPGGGTAAGTVTFREGETVLAVIPLSGAAATYPLKSLPAGEHKITAAYAGNADYEGSGATIVQVITP